MPHTALTTTPSARSGAAAAAYGRITDCLASRPGEIVSHRRILQSVWGPDYGAEVEYLRVFINQLRKKIESDPSHPAFILTEPSEGYRLALPPKMHAA